MKVDIVSRQFIKPSSPTPPEFRNFKLSFLDESIPSYYVPFILYYLYDETRNIRQPEMSERLKRSLSNALTQFYPLAGRMKGSFVDCNDEGVLYVEAMVNYQLSDIIECQEVELLDHFISCKIVGNPSNVEAQLAIQVNLFNCGGIVIGTCVSHRIADAWTLGTFIKTWASIASGDNNNLVQPIFNSASLFPPRVRPDYRPDVKNPAIQPPMEKLVTKRFVFSAPAIAAMKRKVVNSSSTSIVQPTRVELVSALIWKCAISASRVGECSSSVAFHPVNLRGKILNSSLLPDNSFGNLFQMASAVTDGSLDLAVLVSKWRTAFEKIDDEYTRKLIGESGFEIMNKNFKEIGTLLSEKNVLVVRFVSWCKLPLYEADFGWGKPSWVSLTRYAAKNHVFLIDSRCARGIEAWVVMNEPDMARFEQDPELLTFTGSSFPGNPSFR